MDRVQAFLQDTHAGAIGAYRFNDADEDAHHAGEIMHMDGFAADAGAGGGDFAVAGFTGQVLVVVIAERHAECGGIIAVGEKRGAVAGTAIHQFALEAEGFVFGCKAGGGGGDESGEAAGEDGGAVADADDRAVTLAGVRQGFAGFEADDGRVLRDAACFADGEHSGEADFFSAREEADHVGAGFFGDEFFQEANDGGDAAEVIAHAGAEEIVLDGGVGEIPHAEGVFG